MCMPVLVITLALDCSECSASALPPPPSENVHLEALCFILSLHALEKGALTCFTLKSVEVRYPIEGLIA